MKQIIDKVTYRNDVPTRSSMNDIINGYYGQYNKAKPKPSLSVWGKPLNTSYLIWSDMSVNMSIERFIAFLKETYNIETEGLCYAGHRYPGRLIIKPRIKKNSKLNDKSY